MDIAGIYYCRECRISHSGSFRHLKNAYLENPTNLMRGVTPEDQQILENYAYKNIVKEPEHYTSLSRMAVETKKEWEPGRTLTISFMGGSKQVRTRLQKHAKRWTDFANLELDFKHRQPHADIRISFDKNDGSWSYVGTEILAVDKSAPTMNFGWLTPKLEDEEYSRVVLHEFGHTLGCIHEHERPDNGIPWDKEKVYAYYAETDGWSTEEVDSQVFDKYDSNIIRASNLDRKSIMMYPVPEALTKGRYAIGWNTELSPADKKFISLIYPKS